MSVKPYLQVSYETEGETCRSGELFVKSTMAAGGKCF